MKTYEITYIHNSTKQTINIEAKNEGEAGKKFTTMAPDVSADNVLGVVDLAKKKSKNTQLIIGILLAIVGAALFLAKGFFAANLAGASDDQSIQSIAIIGGMLFLIGLIISIFGATEK